MSPLRSLRHTRPTVLLPGIAASVLLLAACGGGGAESAKVATLSTGDVTATTTADSLSVEDTEQAMLDYAACMRDNGVEMQDPTFDADGNVTSGGIGRDSGIDPRSDAFQAAQDVCGDIIQGIQFGGPGGGGGFDPEAMQAALADFTACLRDQGLEVDDITFGQPGDGGPGGDAPDGSLPFNVGDTTGTGGTGGPGFEGGPNGQPPTGGPGAGGPGGDGFDPVQGMIQRLGLDAEDPAVVAAMDACQAIIDDAFTTTTTAG